MLEKPGSAHSCEISCQLLYSTGRSMERTGTGGNSYQQERRTCIMETFSQFKQARRYRPCSASAVFDLYIITNYRKLNQTWQTKKYELKMNKLSHLLNVENMRGKSRKLKKIFDVEKKPNLRTFLRLCGNSSRTQQHKRL